MKVQWKHLSLEEATWELESHMQASYPILFQGSSKDHEQRKIEDDVGLKGGCMSHTLISITFYV